MYQIDFVDTAAKTLENMSSDLALRINNKLNQTRNNPHRYFSRLVSSPYYKLRVGDYRLIAEIIDNKLLILVIHIAHRKSVYKKL
jgi:mRNA interferase RelE/StbE